MVNDNQATAGNEAREQAAAVHAHAEQPAGTPGQPVLPSDIRSATPASPGQRGIPARTGPPRMVRRSRRTQGIGAALVTIALVIVIALLVLNNSSVSTAQPRPSTTPVTTAMSLPVLPAGALPRVSVAAI